ncbi:MAG: hypothetical protein PF689_05865, partial [Deltaproteobacteria bacterium]|nr:hypothetical protein [Deltaproteobacteria bacterium]
KTVITDQNFSFLDLGELLGSEKFSRNKFIKILGKFDSVYWKREVSEFVFNYFNYMHKNSNRGKLAAVEGTIMANDQLRAEFYFNTTLYRTNNPDKLLQQGIQIFLNYGLRRIAARLMFKYLELKKAGFGLIKKADSKFLTKVELDYLYFLFQAGFWNIMIKRFSYLLRHYSSKPWDFEVVKFKITDQFPPSAGWNKKLSQFSSLQYKTIITLNRGSVAQSREILKLLDYIFPARFDINALLCLLDSGSCRRAVKFYKLTSGVYELSELSITRLLQGNWQTGKNKGNLLEFHLFLYALGQTYKINNRDLAILARTGPLLLQHPE